MHFDEAVNGYIGCYALQFDGLCTVLCCVLCAVCYVLCVNL